MGFVSITYVKSCLGKSASLSPYSSITFSEGEICWKGSRLCSCGGTEIEIHFTSSFVHFNFVYFVALYLCHFSSASFYT